MDEIHTSALVASEDDNPISDQRPHPWKKFVGMFKDDPMFDEFVEDMAAYRRKLDAEMAAAEEESEENQVE